MTGLGRQGRFDWLLLGSVCLLGGMGVYNLSSAAKAFEGNMAMLQAIYLGVGVVIALTLSVIDYRLFERLAYPLFVASLLSLLAVLAVGRVVSGSRRWIHLGFFNFQPSEMMKIGIVLVLAKYFSDEQDLPVGGYRLRDLIKPRTPLYAIGALGGLILFWEKDALAALGMWRFVLLGLSMIWAVASSLFVVRSGRTSLHDLLSPVILVLLPVMLIIRQPDLGTSLALTAIAGTMILFMKVRFSSLLIASVVFIAVAIGAWYLLLEDYQKGRIEAFVAPGADTKGTGYHARQSIIAVGSGMMHGKGFRESTQTQFQFLPEQHTDFVFSVWAEEQGFLGCLLVLALFLFLLVQITNVASAAKNRFGMLVGVGMAGFVFWHMFINIGMVIGVLPVVGITLPLWSYGGSSILALMAGVGLLLSISMRRHAN